MRLASPSLVCYRHAAKARTGVVVDPTREAFFSFSFFFFSFSTNLHIFHSLVVVEAYIFFLLLLALWPAAYPLFSVSIVRNTCRYVHMLRSVCLVCSEAQWPYSLFSTSIMRDTCRYVHMLRYRCALFVPRHNGHTPCLVSASSETHADTYTCCDIGVPCSFRGIMAA